MNRLAFTFLASLALSLAAHGQGKKTSEETTIDAFADTDLVRIARPSPAGNFKAAMSDWRTWINAQPLPLGSRTITGALPVANGGTGSTTAAGALTALGVVGQAKVETFTTSGTWTKPTGAIMVEIMLMGGGGGGGSGRLGVAGSARSGGSGGAGGGLVVLRLDASQMGATEAVTVGTGGAGGAAQATADTNGNAGAAGVATVFCGITAPGGNGGAAGTTTAPSASTASSGAFLNSLTGQNAGGAGSLTAGSNGSLTTFWIAGGGGGGGGLDTSNTPRTGGNGSTFGHASIYTITSAGGVIGGDLNGTSPASSKTFYGSPGGGGGATSATLPGGNGGAGANYGAGGGGGGAAENSSGASGAGGNGAPGRAIIITYF